MLGTKHKNLLLTWLSFHLVVSTAAMVCNRPLQFIFWLLFDEVLLYQQSDYILSTERAIVRNNGQKNYSNFKVNFFKFNRTHTGLNFTLTANHDFADLLRVELQAYKFASNEYREFPMAFSANVCKSLKANTFGLQNLYNCGNFTGCPINKRIYHMCNWGPDYSKFPPYLPHGQFKMVVNGKYLKEQLFTLEWYVKIVGVKPF